MRLRPHALPAIIAQLKRSKRNVTNIMQRDEARALYWESLGDRSGPWNRNMVFVCQTIGKDLDVVDDFILRMIESANDIESPGH